MAGHHRHALRRSSAISEPYGSTARHAAFLVRANDGDLSVGAAASRVRPNQETTATIPVPLELVGGSARQVTTSDQLRLREKLSYLCTCAARDLFPARYATTTPRKPRLPSLWDSLAAPT